MNFYKLNYTDPKRSWVIFNKIYPAFLFLAVFCTCLFITSFWVSALIALAVALLTKFVISWAIGYRDFSRNKTTITALNDFNLVINHVSPRTAGAYEMVREYAENYYFYLTNDGVDYLAHALVPFGEFGAEQENDLFELFDALNIDCGRIKEGISRYNFLGDEMRHQHYKSCKMSREYDNDLFSRVTSNTVDYEAMNQFKKSFEHCMSGVVDIRVALAAYRMYRRVVFSGDVIPSDTLFEHFENFNEMTWIMHSMLTNKKTAMKKSQLNTARRLVIDDLSTVCRSKKYQEKLYNLTDQINLF